MGSSRFPVFLFPHSYIREKYIEKVRMYFESLTVCQPWFLKTPIGLPELKEDSFIKVPNPPVDLKPRENFMALLSEYRQWIKNDYDKGYAAFFSIARETGSIEDKPWEIRQMMHRRLEQQSSETLNGQALKWHLILHLAREFEENRAEAEEMLYKLKHHQPPLKDALEDEAPLQGLFEDLSTESLPLSSKSQFMQIVEAWFGLFGGYIPDNGVLLTLDRHIIDYIIDIFDNEFVGFSGVPNDVSWPDFSSIQHHFTIQHIPRISNDVHSKVNPAKTSLSGKTIILLE